MTVRLYKSTDTSAPTLTGQVGSLVALLDAVLVNGYGSQTAAGWTKAFTATNKASYRQGAGSNSFYLDVDDSAPSTAKEARLRGYEAMTAVATGTSPFPTVAQSSFGVIARKSTTADATTRNWLIVADSTCFYLCMDTGDLANPAYAYGVAFGDIFSYKSGDAYHTLLIGRTVENSSSLNNEPFPLLWGIGYSLDGSVGAGQFMARSYTGVGASIPVAKHSTVLSGVGYSGYAYAAVMGANQSKCVYPNGPDGALELAPVWVGHNGYLRGYLKGMWCPAHYRPLGHWDTFTGTGNMAGKSFVAINVQSNTSASGFSGGNDGQLMLEYSDTWS